MDNASEWARCLIGKPYKARATGPDAFDCWGLCVYVWKTFFGMADFPPVACDNSDMKKVSSALRGAASRGDAVNIDAPVNGCAVYMSRAKFPEHIGIFLDIDGGGVLHADSSAGVVFTKINNLKYIGLNIIGFYMPGWR